MTLVSYSSFTYLDDFGVLLIFPALSDLDPDPPFPFPSPFGVLLSVDLDDFDTSAFEDLSFFAPFAVFTDLTDLDPVDLTDFVLSPFADFNTAPCVGPGVGGPGVGVIVVVPRVGDLVGVVVVVPRVGDLVGVWIGKWVDGVDDIVKVWGATPGNEVRTTKDRIKN